MYQHFFNLKERPFKLVPNPEYLYLSRSHEEALGHLNYAVHHGEGFVEITGEVGTGKTTLCRMFLENLDPSTQAAYIFNPKLDAVQLLKAVNDEFGISSKADNVKELVDALNQFLMRQKAQGKQSILLIDEAQNLSREVLEQIRLISNLETTASKLIQIILVGQPELGDLLDSHDLRQLAQRITLNCHLSPLTRRETAEYIQHRLRVASHKPGALFSRSAFRLIHHYSAGIPRCINILCDRALLVAFSKNRHKIRRNTVAEAVRELNGRGGDSVRQRFPLRSLLLLSSLCAVLVILVLFPIQIPLEKTIEKTVDEPSGLAMPAKQIKRVPTPLDPERNVDTEATDPSTAAHETDSGAHPAQGSGHVASPTARMDPQLSDPPTATVSAIPRNAGTAVLESDPTMHTAENATNNAASLSEPDRLEEFLPLFDVGESRRNALKSLLRLWKADHQLSPYLDGLVNDLEYFRLSAKQKGFHVLQQRDMNIGMLLKMNLPVILECYFEGGFSPRYVAVCGIKDSFVEIDKGNAIGRIEKADLEDHWTGKTIVVWKDFYDYNGVIPLNAPRDSILTLKIHLQEIGFEEVVISPFYDAATRAAVKEVQRLHGLKQDGIVGPLTKIALYNETSRLDMPHLSHDGLRRQIAQ